MLSSFREVPKGLLSDVVREDGYQEEELYDRDQKYRTRGFL